MDKYYLIDQLVAQIKDVSEFDVKIQTDDLRHSQWFLGIATAGFIFLASNYDKYAKNIKGTFFNDDLITLSLLLFLVSAIIGALVHKYLNSIMLYNRQRMTLQFYQRNQLLTKIENNDIELGNSYHDIYFSFIKGKYLEGESAGGIKKLTDKIEALTKKSILMGLLQQIFVIASYINVFFIFILSKA